MPRNISQVVTIVFLLLLLAALLGFIPIPWPTLCIAYLTCLALIQNLPELKRKV